MPSKLRQLGCVCVAPTPWTQACADGGRSVRRVVGPRKTMRTVAAVAVGVVGGVRSVLQAALVTTTDSIRAAQVKGDGILPNIDRIGLRAGLKPPTAEGCRGGASAPPFADYGLGNGNDDQ